MRLDGDRQGNYQEIIRRTRARGTETFGDVSQDGRQLGGRHQFSLNHMGRAQRSVTTLLGWPATNRGAPARMASAI
jgi:hypothetical protein